MSLPEGYFNPFDRPTFKCEKCRLCKLKRNYTLPAGNLQATILIIGDAPGIEEDGSGKPFMGQAGQLLRQTLQQTGISTDDIMVMHSVFCRPPKNRQVTKLEIDACRPYITFIMENMPNLKLVIMLGNNALQGTLKLKQIMNKRGTIIRKDGKAFLPILSPAAVLRNPNQQAMFIKDFTFAKEFLSGTIRTGTYICADTLPAVQAAMDYFRAHEYLALDLETSSLDFMTGNIIGISFTAEEYKGYYIPLFADNKEVWEPGDKQWIINELSLALLDENKKFILHHGQFDCNFIKHDWDVDITDPIKRADGTTGFRFYFDTMLAHHLVWQQPPHDLKYLSRQFPDLSYYETELEDYKVRTKMKPNQSYGIIPKEIIYKYGAADADATYRLFKVYVQKLQDLGLWNLMFTMTMPLANVIAKTEYAGIKINRVKLDENRVKLENEIRELENKIYEYAGESFNIRSKPQLKRILFDKLKLPMPAERTKETGDVAINKDTLPTIKHPIAPVIVEYNNRGKFLSTYVKGISDKLDADDVLRAHFNIHGTETGRLCVDGNTVLHTTEGDFKIAELDLSKYPECAILTHRNRFKLITGKYYKGKEAMFTVTLSDGNSITCTGSHRFLALKGWKHLNMLKEGCVLRSYDSNTAEGIAKGIKVSITTIVPVGLRDVWDIQVAEDHSYCACGVINHNSSSGPNLQNIPAKDDYRGMFIPRPGYAFVSADFSQIELRVMALFSNDKGLIDAFKSGRDIHSEVARKVFKVPLGEKVPKEQRKIAKTINFGIIYGIQAKALAEQIQTSEAEAQQFINEYFKQFPGVYAFQEYVKKFVHKHKFVKNIFGRIHNIPDIDHPNEYIRGEAERTALNSPLQGSAAEITNLSSIQIFFKLREAGLSSRLVLSIHDELVYETLISQIQQTASIMYNTMRETAEARLPVPALVDQVIYDRWIEPSLLTQAKYVKRTLGLSTRILEDIVKDYNAKKGVQVVSGS